MKIYFQLFAIDARVRVIFITIILLFSNNEKTNVILNDVTSEDYICLELPPHSMNTVIYNK